MAEYDANQLRDYLDTVSGVDPSQVPSQRRSRVYQEKVGVSDPIFVIVDGLAIASQQLQKMLQYFQSNLVPQLRDDLAVAQAENQTLKDEIDRLIKLLKVRNEPIENSARLADTVDDSGRTV